MTSVIIALVVMGLFILAVMGRMIVLETKLGEVIEALNNHASVINDLNECTETSFLNQTHFAESIDQINEKIKWLDDIDTNKIFDQQ